MPVSKRELLAQAIDKTGLRSVIQFVSRQPLLIIVNYHRLGDLSDNLFDDGVFSATASAFEAQIKFLRDNFRVLQLNEIIELAANDFNVHEPSVLITFDDGYSDNYDIGLPILTKYGVTATFFIPTSYIDRPRLPWWDRISYIIKSTRRKQIVLDFEPTLHINLETNSLDFVCAQVLSYYKTFPKTDPEEFLKHLEDRAEVCVDVDGLGNKLFMSWDQVAKMAAAGMGIGSHAHSHEILAQMSDLDELQELALSKNILENRLGFTINALSYPVGKRNVSFTERTKRNAAAAGYTLAFSFDSGVNLPKITDPFEIQRVGVEIHDSLSMFRTRTLFNALGQNY